MKSPEQRLQVCATCQHKAFSLKTGVSCALTQAKPDFDDECPNYLTKGSAPVTPVAPTKQKAVKKGEVAAPKAVPAPKPATKKAAKKEEDVTVMEVPAPKKEATPTKPVSKTTAKTTKAAAAVPTVEVAPAPQTVPTPAPKPVQASAQPAKQPMRKPRPSKPMPKGVKTVFIALLHTLLTILKIVFLPPYNIWMETAKRLERQKEDGSLNIKEVAGVWNILSYIKRILFNFMFDATIFLSFPIGIIITIINLIISGPLCALITLATAYIAVPFATLLMKDILKLALMPIAKFIIWGSKLAQNLDIKQDKE